MSRPKQMQSFDDGQDEGGFGLETQHFFEINVSDIDHENSDLGVPLNDDGRLRIRPDITLDGPQYTGTKSSRKTALGENDKDNWMKDKSDGTSNEKGGSILYSSESSEEEEHSQGLGAGILGDEMEALNKEYMELQKQEEEMLQSLKGQADEDIWKSQAVSHQKNLWDKDLEIRISLQKLFCISNQLPQENVKSTFCEVDNEMEKSFSLLSGSALKTLDCLSELSKVLMDQNHAISEASEAIVNGNGKRFRKNEEEMHVGGSLNLVEDAWSHIESLYSRFMPFRDSSVDRWQRKTQLSTGAAATKNKLRAFNQSISQQITAFMRDPSRLVQRLQLRHSSVHVLGTPAGTIECQRYGTVDNVGSERKASDEPVDDVDPELFDDAEFYQQLLHEFLEASDPTALGSMNLSGVRKLRNKKRKVVDRRASKGRKIRYNVHDKIMNFMAPEPMSLPPMAEKLFANLFGQQSQERVKA